MLFIPNLGAEQPLANREHLDALRPFVLRAMENLVRHSRYIDSLGESRVLGGYERSYLPAELLNKLPDDGLFAFINTNDVVELARKEGRPLIGSANAMSFHSRGWLYNISQDNKTLGWMRRSPMTSTTIHAMTSSSLLRRGYANIHHYSKTEPGNPFSPPALRVVARGEALRSRSRRNKVHQELTEHRFMS